MQKTKVSAIIPSRNRAKMVTHAIDSALEQDVDGLEIIVIDDASTDDTAQVLSQYGDSIRVVTLSNSLGVAHARNHGIAAANGEWVAFLDSDDLWLPGKIEAQLAAVAADDRVALCFCDYALERAAPNGHWQALKVCGQQAGPRDFSTLFRRNFIGTLTVMLRRDVFHAVGGFDESLHRGSDYDLWLRVAASHALLRVPQMYARYRQHADSLTGLDPNRDRRTYAEITANWIARDTQILSRIDWTMDEWRDTTANPAMKSA